MRLIFWIMYRNASKQDGSFSISMTTDQIEHEGTKLWEWNQFGCFSSIHTVHPPSSLFTLCLSSVISCPLTGHTVPHPERLIASFPCAVHTSDQTTTAIHFLPQSRAAHTSPLSTSASFSASTPSRGGAWSLSKTCWLLIRRRPSYSGLTRHIPLQESLTFVLSLCVLVWDVGIWVFPLVELPVMSTKKRVWSHHGVLAHLL